MRKSSCVTGLAEENKFSKVSALVYSLCRGSIESTFITNLAMLPNHRSPWSKRGPCSRTGEKIKSLHTSLSCSRCITLKPLVPSSSRSLGGIFAALPEFLRVAKSISGSRRRLAKNSRTSAPCWMVLSCSLCPRKVLTLKPIHTRARARTHTHVCMHVCMMYACIYEIFMHACMYIRTCVCMYECLRMYEYTYYVLIKPPFVITYVRTCACACERECV